MGKTNKELLRCSRSHSATKTGLSHQIAWRPLERLTPFPDNPRTHSRQQVGELARSISEFGWTRPIGTDENGVILFGHGCYEAAGSLGLREVPTLAILGLSPAQKRAMVIADNRLAEKSEWNPEDLKVHFAELINVNFDVELTGFSIGAIDLLVGGDTKQQDNAQVEEELPPVRELPRIRSKLW